MVIMENIILNLSDEVQSQLFGIVDDNWNTIINNDTVNQNIDINTNKISLLLQQEYPFLSDEEIKKYTFTFLMALLFLVYH